MFNSDFLILRIRDRRWICRKAVGGYYISIAELLTDDKTPDPPEERVIINESSGTWLITAPGNDKGDKVPWVRCANLYNAQKVLENVR